jgi:radical SAM protein with 4Fe4S-binding SPASM domain
VKNWFRAYLNLGLMHKVLGRDRLIPCTAATDFTFVDPWGDVYACNVRPDLLMGNIREAATWEQVWNSDTATRIRGQVSSCSQNCWMVTTARTAMRNPLIPSLPKLEPLMWVLENKMRLAMGMDIRVDERIDNLPETPAPKRVYYMNAKIARVPTLAAERDYARFGTFFNR